MIRRKFIHNSPYTDTRTHPYAYSYSYYFRCYLSLSLSHSVVASLPGGFHVQLVLLEWSAAAPKAATETASARRQRWQRPAFITVCAFWVFFASFIFGLLHVFLYTLQHLFVSNYCGNLFIRQQSVQTKTTTTTAAKLTPQGGRPTKESSSSTCSSSPPPFHSLHFSLLSECL